MMCPCSWPARWGLGNQIIDDFSSLAGGAGLLKDCGTCRRVLGSRLRRGCVPSKEDARQERSYCGVLDDRSVRRGLL